MTPPPPSTDTARADARSLAASLAPLVAQACDGRLGEVTWFRTDWQRGGAATGKSTYLLEDGTRAEVVLKLPVVQRELLWTQRLQSSPDGNDRQSIPIPRLFACGETIGGYDLAWLVIEHVPHGPLGLHWHEDHVPRIADAVARFHAAADVFPIDQDPKTELWQDLIADASESARVNHVGHQQRWTAALKLMRQRIGRVLTEWNARDTNHWLHGDVHLANAMSRTGMDHGPVCLIDMAEVHVGHWVEDAVYLERQLWARPERIQTHKPVKLIAAARKRLGLPVEIDYPRLAMIRRALLAATAPKFLKSEGHPAYLDACLTWLEIALNELK